MRYVTSPKHAFLNYGTASGVYPLGDKTVLAVAGDWGTGTDEAQHVTCEMKKHNPDTRCTSAMCITWVIYPNSKKTAWERTRAESRV